MAGLYEKPSETYAKKRPRYPKEWFSMLSGLTAEHHRAWDGGCGSGQAAISVSLLQSFNTCSGTLGMTDSETNIRLKKYQMAEHYESVVATDVSEGQLRNAMAHPRVRYVHTPEHLTEDELVALVGGEGSLDLIVVATSIHWFDIPLFYAVASRALRKPGGVLAVWGYNYEIHPFEDALQGQLYAALRPYQDPRARLATEDRYRWLPFPFEPVGVGAEGAPADMDMEVEMTLEDLAGFVMTGSVVTTAREKGAGEELEAVVRDVMRRVEQEWGDAPTVPRKLAFKAFMLAGRPKC
jgi:SAM-dependent methyltransferase